MNAPTGGRSRMLQEIAEQPAAVARTVDALLPLQPALRRLADGRRHVLFVARGSSDNAAVYGRYLLEVHAGRPAALAAPSLATHYAVEVDLSDTLVVSLSQSGETEEIVETQRWAARQGARTVAISNRAESPLVAGADVALVTSAGVELAVPATKTYTAQLAAVAVLAGALGSGLDLGAVPAAIERLLDADVEPAAALLADGDTTLVAGRGLTYSTALEVALKLEETCLRPVRGLSYADLRHGPIAVLGPGTVAVIVAPADGPVLPGLTALAATVQARGARVLGLGGDRAFAAGCDGLLPGPDLPETLAALALIVPGQLAVEALARRLGLDPDAPRGLSKVTQTDPTSS